MFADYTKLCRTIKAEEDSEISQTEAPGHGPRFWWMIGKIGSLAASRYITLWIDKPGPGVFVSRQQPVLPWQQAASCFP